MCNKQITVMKKHFFRMVAALTLVCGAFAFTGCTDFEEDINAVNDRIDQLQTGQIAELNQQLANLDKAIGEANDLITAVKTDLEGADKELQGLIDGLTSDISGINDQIKTINSNITDLEADLEKQIADAVSELEGKDSELAGQIADVAADLKDAQAALENKDTELAGQIADVAADLEAAREALSEEIAKGDEANATAITNLAQTVTDNYTELKGLIEAANKAHAELAQKVDENFNTLKGLIDAADVANKAEFEKVYGEIEALNKELDTTNEALVALTSTVTNLSGRVEVLEKLPARIEALEATVKEIQEDYLTKEDAASTYATLTYVAELEKKLGEVAGSVESLGEELRADIANLGLDLEDLSKKVTELESTHNADVETLKGLIANAQQTADQASANIETLTTVTIPAIESKVETAQETADAVLGDLDALKEALGQYAEAGKLAAKITELEGKDDELAKQDAELAKQIEELGSTTASEITAVYAKINEVKGELEGVIAEAAKTQTAALEALDTKLTAAIETAVTELEGKIDEKIAATVLELHDEIVSNFDNLSDRIDDVEEQIADMKNQLTGLINDMMDDIYDLANRIQSLVFVPEYDDGKATVVSYTLFDEIISDNIVTATFQVTPAELAQALAAQEANVTAKVITVATRAAEGPAFTANKQDGSLTIVANNKVPGYVDVTIDIPQDKASVIAGVKSFSFALCVSPDSPSAEENPSYVGSSDYVSEYVQVYAESVSIDDKYVLYNKDINKEYPATDVLETEVNEYERAWSYPEAYKEIDFYGTNPVYVEGEESAPAENDSRYELYLKLGEEEYYTLADAAEMFGTDVEKITPAYSYEVEYTDEKGNEWDKAEAEEYLTVNPVAAEIASYGVTANMLKTAGMTEVIGHSANITNTFAFVGEDGEVPADGSRTVLTNIGKYTVVNEDIELNITAENVAWTYELAEELSDVVEGVKTPNVKALVLENVPFTVKNLGDIDIKDLVTYHLNNIVAGSAGSVTGTSSFTVATGDAEAAASEMKISCAVVEYTPETEEEAGKGTMTVTVTGYDFSSEGDNAYVGTVTSYNKGHDCDVNVNFTVTLGQMPGGDTYEYAIDPETMKIAFMLPGSNKVDYIELENGFEAMFNKAAEANTAWYADAETFTTALTNEAVTKYSAMRGEQKLYDNKEIVSDYKDVTTRLTINPVEGDVEHDPSYIRVSSYDITSTEDGFGFTTVIETWFGATYTFTTSAALNVETPDIYLEYVNTFVKGSETENPYVQLDYKKEGNAPNEVYKIEDANVGDYFDVRVGNDEYANVESAQYQVAFEILTETANGYANIPTLTNLGLDGAGFKVLDGMYVSNLADQAINWSAYTARDLKIKATLQISANGSNWLAVGESRDLTIQVYPIVEAFAQKTAEDTAYEDAAVEVDGDYIVIRRDNREDLTIRLWEYLKAVARFSEGENFIPYLNVLGVRHNALENVNGNPAMKMYGASIIFDADYDAANVGYEGSILMNGYNATTGTLLIKAQDGAIANAITFEVPVTLNYYLDYNHVAGEIAETGVIGDEFQPVIGARTTTLKIKIMDK